MTSILTKTIYFKRELAWFFRDLSDFLLYKIFGKRGRYLSILVPPETAVPQSQSTKHLIDLLANVSRAACSLNIYLDDKPDSCYANIFPGEHYKLLAALTASIRPRAIVEIGTSTGLSSVVFREFSPPDSEIHTFDIVPWHLFDTHLKQEYFSSGRLYQHISDLSKNGEYSKYAHIFQSAELIFLDGPKNYSFEKTLLSLLSKSLVPSLHTRLLIIDDIRFANMVDLWIAIKSPKIDATSFGHFSGTGIVDITHGLSIED